MVAQTNRLTVIKKIQKMLPAFCLAAFLAFGVSAAPVVLSDDETETFLADVVKPIFHAAGIPYDSNKIHILNDMSLNAFVSDGNHLFVHTGTLIEVKNTNELFGILAHETGHISGGHILRQKLKINDLKTLSAISLMAAGAAAVASGRGDAAMAVALGSQGSLINIMLAHQLTEERSADESAVRYLKAIGQSPIGLKNFMNSIQKNHRLSGFQETPYFKTHPMSAERMAFFEKAAKDNGGKTTSPLDPQLKLVQAKLNAFLLPPERVYQKYPLSDKTTPAEYAHAIVLFKQKKFAQAVSGIDALIKKQPNNPYFYQLKGQFLFESGKASQALLAYEKALQIKPDSNETLLLYAECAIELPPSQKNLQQIVNTLNKLLIRQETPHAWELLSRAYYEQGKEPESLYAAAKYSVSIGNFDAAQKQIKKAQTFKLSETLKLKLSDLTREIKHQNDEL